MIGAGVTGRVVQPGDSADDSDDEHDDKVKTAAVVQPADRLLTHPPRPRKKKKR